MKHYNDLLIRQNDATNSTDGSDNVQPATKVYIALAGTRNLASLYDGEDLNTANQIANPITTDNYGRMSFYIEDGDYDFYTNFNTDIEFKIKSDEPIYDVKGATVSFDHSNATNRSAVGAHDDIYTRTKTLSQAIVEDASVGTRYVITDFGEARYDVVLNSDTGGIYKPLNATKKLKLVYDSLLINNKAVDNSEYNLSIFGGALRRTPFSGSNKWEHITDAAHEPYGVSATVDDVDDYQFRIHYSNAAGENVKVGTTLFTLDYELAPYGIMTGANGGINSSTYQMYAPCTLYIDGGNNVSASPLWTTNGLGITSTGTQYAISHPPRALAVDPPMLTPVVAQGGSTHATQYEIGWGATQTTITAKEPLAGYIVCDGTSASVSLSRNVNLSATVADGVITITHDNVAGRYIAEVTPFGSDAYTPHILSVGDTVTIVGFKDETGTVVTAPSSRMKFMFNRNALVASAMDGGLRFGLDLGLCRVKNQDVGNVSLNNFWYIGFNNV